MKKTNTGHAQEQPLNCCVMTMGIKHAEQLVLLFGKTRVMQLMNQLSEQAAPASQKSADCTAFRLPSAFSAAVLYTTGCAASGI